MDKPLKKILEKLTEQIESLALEAVILDPGDIPGLGRVLESIEAIGNLLGELRKESLIPLIPAMKGYIEKVILGEESDLSPFETCISQLQEICRDLINEKDLDRDISPLLTGLGCGEITPPGPPSGPERDNGAEAEEDLQRAKGDDLGNEDRKKEMEGKT